MTLACIRCGTYELTPREEFLARLTASSWTHGTRCFRCNEEARIVRPPRDAPPYTVRKES